MCSIIVIIIIVIIIIIKNLRNKKDTEKNDLLLHKLKTDCLSLAESCFQLSEYILMFTSLRTPSSEYQLLVTSPVVTTMSACTFYINGIWCWLLLTQLSREKTKKCLLSYVKCVDSHHRAHAKSLTWTWFVLNWNILMIQGFCLWTVNALIRLHRCAGWPGPSLCAHAQRHIFAWPGQFRHDTNNARKTLIQ